MTVSADTVNYQVIKSPEGRNEYNEGERARLAKNFRRAEKFLSKSAQKGYAPAHFRLGQMYATGRGSVRSIVDAHMHYNLASYLGLEEGRKAMLVIEPQMSDELLEKAMRRAINYRKRHKI
jgi:TPR repeat protein